VLGGMEENLSAAFSQIADTDVAEENSRLVRAQILVQASISSLLMAGQRRSQIGSLLGGL
jgi:flagellin-like hook-associated protein FlgL